MKKTFIIAASVGLIVFVTITVLKNKPTGKESSKTEKTLTTNEKQNIRQFWKHYRLATNYRIAGKPEQALIEYQKALRFNQKHEDALYYAGNLYCELGDYDKAVNCWKELLLINPQSARTHLQLGDIYLGFADGDLFDPEAAEIEYRRALEINGEESKALLRTGQLALIKGNLKEAENRFGALQGPGSTGITASFLLGYLEWRQGLNQSALRYFKKSIAYSRPEETVGGFSNEGDTRPGNRLDVSQRFEENPLFNTQLSDLGNNALHLAAQMELKYQELDAYLTKIRKRNFAQ